MQKLEQAKLKLKEAITRLEEAIERTITRLQIENTALSAELSSLKTVKRNMQEAGVRRRKVPVEDSVIKKEDQLNLKDNTADEVAISLAELKQMIK